MSSVSIDIDIDDIVYSMSKYERRELFKILQKDGHISESCLITNDGEITLRNEKAVENNNQFNSALDKLYDNSWRLTKEEEEYIIKLSNRFV